MPAWAAALVVGLALAACGDDDDAPPDPDGDAACAAAGEDGHVTIEVDNRDDGVNHNLHLADAPGEPTTDLEAGPVVQQLEVELPAGRYRFVCDIHPTRVGSLEAVRQSVPTGG